MQLLTSPSLSVLLSFLFLFPAGLLSQPLADPDPDTLVVGYYESAPFIIETNGELEGISPWLWDNIAEEINRPYVLKKLTLAQLLEELESGQVDLSMVPLTITRERSEKLDFSPPYYIAHSTLLVESRSPLEKALQFVGSFFNLNFLRALGALFFVILIFGLFEWLFERKQNAEEFGPGLKGIWNGIWWSAVTMTTVGYGDKSPRTTGGRIVALIWMFAAIIIISGFTASIASSLTVNQLSWNQNDIQAFKDRMVATVEQSATERWLERHFFKKLAAYPTLSEALAALETEEVDAVAYDNPLLQYLVSNDSIGGYEVLPISYNLQLYAIGYSEHLRPVTKEIISNSLLGLIESTDWQILLAEYGLSVDP